jgi:PAS domain S-box-containing protein
MFLVKLVLVTAAVVQMTAAAIALRLVRLTGRRWAWGLVASAILLMVARRGMPLYRILTGDPSFSSDLSYELMGLVISLALLAGLIGMWPVFVALRKSRDTLRWQGRRLKELLQLERMAEAPAQEMVDFALREAVRLTRSQWGCLVLFEDQSTWNRYDWSKSSKDPCSRGDVKSDLQFVQTASWQQAYEQRQPVYAHELPAATNPASPSLESEPAQHVLHLPVLDGQRVVAIASVTGKRQPYDESDSQHLAVLIQNLCRLIQRQQAARQRQRLTIVLSAIRNVNQLISREKDPPRLFESVCQTMVQDDAYRDAWIGQVDDSLRLVNHWQAGTNGTRAAVTDAWREGRWSESGHQLLAQGQVTVVPHVACLAAEVVPESEPPRTILATRLEYRQRVFGLLIAQLPTDVAVNAQEQSLFVELAGDLALAMYSLELDQQRRRAEQALQLEQSRLEALLKLGQMTDVDLQTITDFALEEAVQLTQSQIGYLAFTTEDESVLIMHSWSKTAMKECAIIDKPIEYPVVTTGLWGEAVRQRRPVITNDYAAPNPWKKGYPGGHVTVRRHMNVPIFEGDRIVAVLGAGNKTAPYDESDVRQLTLLGQGMWRLLQRKRAEEALREARNQLEARVEQRTTELRAANDELQHERYLLRTLMDQLPHAIYFKDAQSRFLRINRALSDMFGLAGPAEAVGKTDRDFFTAEHADRTIADEQRIVQTGQPIIDYQEKETWPDGRITWASTTKMPLYDENGQITGTFGLSRDITEQKLAAETLQAAKEAAEAANQAKSSFLANMSHEIRTPLNAVIGMSELLLDTQLTPQQHEFLAIVRDAGESLLAVVNDVLDLSKIEAGKLTLEHVPFDLWEHVGDTMKSFTARADQRKLELACRIHPDVPRLVVGDASRLRQIIVNLVGNALKFTEQGEVVLEVQREIRTADEVVLHFVVRDTGIGIPQHRQAAIFEMFEQADSSSTRRYGGTGLGLTICQRLASLMSGRIWLESEPDIGSRFHFTARLGIRGELLSRPPQAELSSLRGMHVLVVDDNATNRRILEEVLRGWQLPPVLASHANAAWEELQRAEAEGQPYRLMLTDVQMPEIDGLTLVERIRRESPAPHPAIVMLTSGDHAEDLGRCQDLGIAAFLIKPVKQSELFEAILTALGVAHIEQAAKPAPTVISPSSRSLRILLAEDSQVNQKLAVSLLKRLGHETMVVANGQEALAAIESETFDLILMDVQLPEMDGLEATRRIRSREQSLQRHTPIIAMTAHALKGDRERCLDAGMDGYVAKPVRLKTLAEAIDGALVGGENHETLP